MIEYALSNYSFLALVTVLIIYGFLIAEKRNKVLIVGIGACLLLFLQVFHHEDMIQQDVAFAYVANNLGVL
jgi:Na+/H+ antiporter NhaD/arsenite permease-like protein